jgi:hypothetical protein
MPLWRAQIDFMTPAGGVRQWEGMVEADTVVEATERAMRDFRTSRPRRELPEVLDFQLVPVDGG